MKKTRQTKPEAKPKEKSPSFSSQQWISESTRGAAVVRASAVESPEPE
jgi:hypothetical protein